MLILLLFFALFQRLQGAPLFDTESSASAATSFISTDLSSFIPRSQNHFGTRTTSDIITTCLATIFACTWTAIHPNVPAPNDSGFDIFKRRVRMLFCALLAPEAIATFALRQRLAASQITEKYNSWVEMQRRNVLSEVATRTTITCSSANSPTVSNVLSLAENPTRSGHIFTTREKAGRWILWLPNFMMDWFRRPALASPRAEGQIERWTTTHAFFFQMGGYMASKNGIPRFTIRNRPCIYYTDDKREIQYRGIEGLIEEKKICAPTTTAADIADRSKGNVISKTVVILQTTWFLAQCIARWSTGLAVTELEVITLGFVVLNGLTYACWWHKPQNVGVPVYLEWVSDDDVPVDPQNNPTKTGFIRRKLRDLVDSKDLKSFTMTILNLLFAPFAPIAALLNIVNHDDLQNYVPLRVSIFHSQYSRSSPVNGLSLSMSAVGMLFGAVHVAPAWVIIFPSHSAMIIWRTCAIVTTVIPITIVPIISLTSGYKDSKWLALLIFVNFSYITSRIALFVLAFNSLRHLSPHALIAIEWLSVFPHI